MNRVIHHPVLPILNKVPRPPSREAPVSPRRVFVPKSIVRTRRASDPNIHTRIRPRVRIAPVEVYKPAKVHPIRPKTPALEIDEPPPVIYVEAATGRYGIRCICGNQVCDGVMTECCKCGFWVHNLCVNLARTAPNEKYFCPFCRKRPIRCTCGDAKRYSEPLVQCNVCRYWVHRACAHLGYGRDPPRFICTHCGGYETTTPVCALDASCGLRDVLASPDTNRIDIVQQIPDGSFRNFVLADLGRGEMGLFGMMARYFNAFCECIFDEDKDFWKVFVSTMSQLLGVSQDVIFRAIDFLACQLLYRRTVAPEPALFVALSTFSLSERVELEIRADAYANHDKKMAPVEIVMKDGRPCVKREVAENEFICEVPGFVCVYTEMPASNGLSLDWISIPNTDYVIDTDKTSFTMCRSIRRSFHYNCHPRIIRIHGELRVALFAHRLRGPGLEKQTKKGPAIPEGGELILPLDSDLPYPVPKINWRERKRHRTPPQTKEPEPPATLLSLFYDPSAPRLPVQVMSKEEFQEKERSDVIRASGRMLTRKSLHKQCV